MFLLLLGVENVVIVDGGKFISRAWGFRSMPLFMRMRNKGYRQDKMNECVGR